MKSSTFFNKVGIHYVATIFGRVRFIFYKLVSQIQDLNNLRQPCYIEQNVLDVITHLSSANFGQTKPIQYKNTSHVCHFVLDFDIWFEKNHFGDLILVKFYSLGANLQKWHSELQLFVSVSRISVNGKLWLPFQQFSYHIAVFVFPSYITLILLYRHHEKMGLQSLGIQQIR